MRNQDTIKPDDRLASPKLLWILRIGLACCYIGHGALGLSKVAAWTSYFGVVGIGPERALTLMPWVGAFDVAMGLSVLLLPIRGVILYMAIWGLWTALLRPLAGESFWETIERAGNYGIPLALYFLLVSGRSVRTWLGARFGELLDASREQVVSLVLRLTTAFLLIGHGALGCIVQKPMFSTQYNLIGLHNPTVAPLVGGFECLLALAVLVKPDRRLLLGVVFWKLATEALCPMAGSPLWVFVEHGGSYAAPLALAFLVARSRSVSSEEEAFAN